MDRGLRSNVKRKAILTQKEQSPARHCKIFDSGEAELTRVKTLYSESVDVGDRLVRVNGLIKLGSNLGGRPRRRVVVALPLVEDTSLIPGTVTRVALGCCSRERTEVNLTLFTRKDLSLIPGEDEGLGVAECLTLFVAEEIGVEQQTQPRGLSLRRGCSKIRAFSLSRFERRAIVTRTNQLSRKNSSTASYKKA